jgi:hypothetical protein
VVVVVSPEPLRGVVLCLFDSFDDVLVQQLMPNRPVVALDISVLLGLAGLDVLDGNRMFLRSFSQRFVDIFGTVVEPNGSR